MLRKIVVRRTFFYVEQLEVHIGRFLWMPTRWALSWESVPDALRGRSVGPGRMQHWQACFVTKELPCGALDPPFCWSSLGRCQLSLNT